MSETVRGYRGSRCETASILSRTVGALVLMLAVSLPAGRLLARQDQDPMPTFSGRTELVVLHVSVHDRRGGFVPGLDRSAFQVFEDGKPQEVTLFLNQDAPVTVGLLIDNSTSMRESRDLVITAAAEFAAAGHREDELFALAFNESVTSVLSPDAPFTRDPVHFKSALSAAISARGQTAFFDALAAGLEYAARGQHPRRVLVAITDGGDNASWRSVEDVLGRAQSGNVVVYTVTPYDPLNTDGDPRLLERITRSTGGQRFRPDRREEMSEALQRIASDIRHTYTVGYSPSRPPDGGYRKLEVRVRTADGRRADVRTRAGYSAVRRAEDVDAVR